MLQQRHPGNPFQPEGILLMVAAVCGDEFVHAFQRSEPHRRGHLGHLSVGAQVDDFVVVGEAEIGHQAELSRQPVVVGGDGTAFERIQKLGGMKTEDLGQTEAANHPPAMRAAKSVGSVEQEFQSAPVRDLRERSHRTRPPPNVRRQDPGGPGGDLPLDLGRVQVVGRRVHFREDRRDLLPLQGMGRGDKGEGRNDDFSL